MSVSILIKREPDIYTEIEPSLHALAGNKDIFSAINTQLPCVYAEWNDVQPEDIIIRPTDFKKWYSFVKKLPNNKLFKNLIQLIENDETLWLDFSY